MIGILIAEDNHALRELLAERLVSKGFEVYQAPNGRIALDLVSKHHPQAIVTDFNMPGLSGLELTQMARAMGVTAPIYLFSGETVECAEAFLAAGGTLTFQKPDDGTRLIEMIETRHKPKSRAKE